jgi:hypothetical protein
MAEGMDPSFQAKLMAMIGASGGKIKIVSGYRSNEEQAALRAKAEKAHPGEADKWAAKPGSSNHNKGFAADLGGDLELAHKLAPQFGLHFPMSWEDWHVEPLGLRSNKDAYTTPPDDMTSAVHNPMAELAQLFENGAPTEAFGEFDPASVDATIAGAGAGAVADASGGAGFSGQGGDDVDSFMARIAGQESGGNYNAVNKSSGAHGKFQIMPANWGPWAKEAGLGANAPKTPENQDKVARFKMQQYYNQFGDWDLVAKAWYSGPGNVHKNVSGGGAYPDSDTYAKQVAGR